MRNEFFLTISPKKFVSTARRQLIYTNNISQRPIARKNVWILIIT